MREKYQQRSNPQCTVGVQIMPACIFYPLYPELGSSQELSVESCSLFILRARHHSRQLTHTINISRSAKITININTKTIKTNLTIKDHSNG